MKCNIQQFLVPKIKKKKKKKKKMVSIIPLDTSAWYMDGTWSMIFTDHFKPVGPNHFNTVCKEMEESQLTAYYYVFIS